MGGRGGGHEGGYRGVSRVEALRECLTKNPAVSSPVLTICFSLPLIPATRAPQPLERGAGMPSLNAASALSGNFDFANNVRFSAPAGSRLWCPCNEPWRTSREFERWMNSWDRSSERPRTGSPDVVTSNGLWNFAKGYLFCYQDTRSAPGYYSENLGISVQRRYGIATWYRGTRRSYSLGEHVISIKYIYAEQDKTNLTRIIPRTRRDVIRCDKGLPTISASGSHLLTALIKLDNSFRCVRKTQIIPFPHTSSWASRIRKPRTKCEPISEYLYSFIH